MIVRFQVAGIPAPQGSKRAYVNKHTGKAALVEMGVRHKDWRAMVTTAAADAMGRTSDWGRVHLCPPISGPVNLAAVFRFPRPKGHYRTGKNSHLLRDTAPTHPGKPDLSKLVRSVEDAMTGIVYRDDSQVVSYDRTCKRWAEAGETPGVAIEVRIVGLVVEEVERG